MLNATQGRHPAVTRTLPKVLQAGDKFTSRFDRGYIQTYWVDGEEMTIPAGMVGLVEYGDPANVGVVRVIWADTQAARRAVAKMAEGSPK
jgi:hypothetical protein